MRGFAAYIQYIKLAENEKPAAPGCRLESIAL
jgi:hypothetical protein